MSIYIYIRYHILYTLGYNSQILTISSILICYYISHRYILDICIYTMRIMKLPSPDKREINSSETGVYVNIQNHFTYTVFWKMNNIVLCLFF